MDRRALGLYHLRLFSPHPTRPSLKDGHHHPPITRFHQPAVYTIHTLLGGSNPGGRALGIESHLALGLQGPNPRGQGVGWAQTQQVLTLGYFTHISISSTFIHTPSVKGGGGWTKNHILGNFHSRACPNTN